MKATKYPALVSYIKTKKTKKVYAVLIGYKNDGYTGDVKIFATPKDANNYALEFLNSYDPKKQGNNTPFANVIQKQIL